jgi:hypothetical protein
VDKSTLGWDGFENSSNRRALGTLHGQVILRAGSFESLNNALLLVIKALPFQPAYTLQLQPCFLN